MTVNDTYRPGGGGGFLEQKPRSPTSLALVLLLHGAAIGALLLAKGPEIIAQKFGKTEVELIPLDEPPPETEPEPKQRQQQQETFVERPQILVPIPRPPIDFQADPLPERTIQPLPPGPVDILPPQPQPRVEPAPPPAPVRVEAEVDPRHAGALQPPYPASEERMGNEGSVAIRVTIGTDGRVKEAEKVRATSEAFWRATERHARANWRFRPATLDGRPVESKKVMTVHFQIRN
jgi:periplasmic protein TonB